MTTWIFIACSFVAIAVLYFIYQRASRSPAKPPKDFYLESHWWLKTKPAIAATEITARVPDQLAIKWVSEAEANGYQIKVLQEAIA